MRNGRNTWTFIIFRLSLLLLVGVGISLSYGAPALALIEEGKPAPEFALTSLDGRTIKLSDYRGKVLLLDFWHTY